MRLIIADDHALFRDSLKSLLTARGLDVAGEAENGRQAVELTKELEPDVVLMDLSMPEMNGLEATRAIVSACPGVKVIVLTASSEDQDLFDAIKAGAEGYLLKNLESDRFFELLEGVRRGEPALTPSLARKVLKELAQPTPAPKAADPNPDALTQRETEVLELMVQGITSNKGLADALGVSENTVKFHVRNILDKLHVHNRAQVVGVALRTGIIDPR
ncbi:MAG: response regulator transcription factor [Acidobacteriota bacterium]